jgi:hypothetical protein
MSMSATVAAADWIKKIADDERQRDTARVTAHEVAQRKADVVARLGRRLVDDLRAAVVRDVDAFRAEFTGDAGRNILVDAAADGGFIVRKPEPSAVSLAVVPAFESATMLCHYRFDLGNGLPPREDRIDVLFTGSGETLQMKLQGSAQVFLDADSVSEFLLVPMFTGRPR